MWFQIYVGLDEDKEDIKGNTDWRYKQQDIALYWKYLQVQWSVQKMWLFFSHEKIDIKALTNEIKLWATRNAGITIPMALVQSAIQDRKPWKETTNNRKTY